jgi:hypothetical protein
MFLFCSNPAWEVLAMPKLRKFKHGVVLIAALCLSSATALAQTYWGQRAQPLPSAAPQIPQGPQAFQPNPSLGTQSRLPPNYFQPQPQPAPQGSFNVLNMENGTMKTCRAYGNTVTCF